MNENNKNECGIHIDQRSVEVCAKLFGNKIETDDLKFEGKDAEELEKYFKRPTYEELEVKLKESEWKLQEAIKLLEEGKRQFAPNTTNSIVDDFIERYKEKENE